MARGGPRVGAGRKRGGVNSLSLEARKAAAKTGELPHELLLALARGQKSVLGKSPTDEQRIDAMKAAAPYYAPRLMAMAAKVTDAGNPWEELFRLANGQTRGLPSQDPE